MIFENTIVVKNKTRLEQLVERFNTKAQARFYIEHLEGDFNEYEKEHEVFHESMSKVVNTVHHFSKHKVLERKFLSNFLFDKKDVIVVLGQDGLVANAAKYVDEQPIVGVNPDPTRNDGILLPFDASTVGDALEHVFAEDFGIKKVTMAEAKTNDGQKLIAFNDLFIGPASHTSARYKIRYGAKSELQSSSGLIISTGAGSTGWMSSVLNMANGIHSAFGKQSGTLSLNLNWDDERLFFAVREPFKSKHSDVSISAGYITKQNPLIIESNMPFNGVIFSDGIESDFLNFNSGCTVQIGVAKQKAHIVQSN